MGSIDRINKAVVAGGWAAVSAMMAIVLGAHRAPVAWEWLYILGAGGVALLHVYATPNSGPPLVLPSVAAAQRYPRPAPPAHLADAVTQVQPRVPGAPVQ